MITKKLQVTHQIQCGLCDGTGYIPREAVEYIEIEEIADQEQKWGEERVSANEQ
jgi:hypothetical protein